MTKRRVKDGAGQRLLDFESPQMKSKSTEEKKEALEAFNSGASLEIITPAAAGKTTPDAPGTSNIATQATSVSEPLKSKPALDPKAIIDKFIIIDGSNVLHWMKDNKQDDKVNLIPLLIILTALNRNGFDFCSYFDAAQVFEMQEKQAGHFEEFEKLRKKYKTIFSVAPGGASADEFILLDAKKTKRKVLSNDRFRDHRTQLPQSQLIKGAVVNCQILIPKLDIIESLILDLRKAVRDLDAALKGGL